MLDTSTVRFNPEQKAQLFCETYTKMLVSIRDRQEFYKQVKIYFECVKGISIAKQWDNFDSCRRKAPEPSLYRLSDHIRIVAEEHNQKQVA